MLTLKNIGSIVEIQYNGKMIEAVVDMVMEGRVHLVKGQLGITTNMNNFSVVELNEISSSELATIEALLEKIEVETDAIDSIFEEGEDDYYEAMEEKVEPLEAKLRAVVKSAIK